ncbi:endonuclease/exonuclease/phosphatase family protein [Actinoplanes sp. NPDC089786]|uniref:endonuclease/exonuclease/phosphatase family protein n=1 Tax=Actinoplanes sp. NPDC089786 TaxID=3155185 RepID=UPI00342E2390
MELRGVARRAFGLAVGVLLFVDVLRVWLPSIITIFGQAASTPAWLLGAFGLVWLLGGFAAPPLCRWLGPRRVAVAAAVLLGAARAALLFVHGGRPQLYLASAGLLAGIGWLAATADRGARVSPGVPLGIAAASIQHAVLGMVDLSWRTSWWAWLAGLAEVAAFLWLSAGDQDDPESPAGGWFIVGPALLLAGMLAVSPALNSVALSYLGAPFEDTNRPFLHAPISVAGALLFLWSAVSPPERLRLAAGLGLVGGTVVFAYAGGRWLPVAILLAAPSLGICVGLAAERAKHRGYALVSGVLVFGLAAIAYYAAYDIGYPNQWVPVAVGLAAAVYAWRAPGPARVIVVRPAVVVTAVVLLGVSTGLAGVARTSGDRRGPDQPRLRLVAYNIRMGFGLNGRFDPDATARAIAVERPDVVALSEVDRAWLLNGGHDDLALLARRLDMHAYFAPAADPVWGDAILTRLRVGTVRSLVLPAAGAPTGAQALGVTVPVAGREWTVVATHLQPPPDGAPDAQARALTAFAKGFGGGPTVIAGDLNIAPDGTTMGLFRDGGLADGLAPFRPVPTFPAGNPVEEIDHILVLGGLRVTDVRVGTTTASDHAPVAVTLEG